MGIWHFPIYIYIFWVGMSSSQLTKSYIFQRAGYTTTNQNCFRLFSQSGRDVDKMDVGRELFSSIRAGQMEA